MHGMTVTTETPRGGRERHTHLHAKHEALINYSLDWTNGLAGTAMSRTLPSYATWRMLRGRQAYVAGVA